MQKSIEFHLPHYEIPQVSPCKWSLNKHYVNRDTLSGENIPKSAVMQLTRDLAI